MNVFTFIVGMFQNRGDSRGMREAVREAAVKDAREAVTTYADAFETETRRLLAERQQQVLALTADHIGEAEDVDFTVVEAEEKPRPKRRAR